MTKAPTTLRDLPNDILMSIIDYLDSNSLLQTGLASKFISRTSIQQLWHTSICTTPLALELFISTLNQPSTIYPYHDWLMGLDISLEIMQALPDDTLLPLLSTITTTSIAIKTLHLSNVHATAATSLLLTGLFIQGNIREINVRNCSAEIISSLATHFATMATNNASYEQLFRICIEDCYITDPWVRQIVSSTPRLRYFSSQRSGYISDTAILAITQNCPLIETLIATLPKHIIQSNTITFTSLQSLSNCIHLKTLVCRGQVRISNEESQDWLYKNCPSLEYCDLSF